MAVLTLLAWLIVALRMHETLPGKQWIFREGNRHAIFGFMTVEKEVMHEKGN